MFTNANGESIPARFGLDSLNIANYVIESGGHEFVHFLWLTPLDEMRRIAIAAKEVVEFLVADPSQDAGIGNFVAVEVQDRQNRAVRDRV